MKKILFLFSFQLQWGSKRRRKVNQLFSFDWSVFQALTAMRNVFFFHSVIHCDDIHHLMCYHQRALSMITQLSFPALFAPFYLRQTQPRIRYLVVLIGKKMAGFCYHVRICQREQNFQCTMHADLTACSLQNVLSIVHLISSF